jgi:hypothetical protein
LGPSVGWTIRPGRAIYEWDGAGFKPAPTVCEMRMRLGCGGFGCAWEADEARFGY